MYSDFDLHLLQFFVVIVPLTLHKYRSFPFRISSVNVTKTAVSADLVTFTEKINAKLQFLRSVRGTSQKCYSQKLFYKNYKHLEGVLFILQLGNPSLLVFFRKCSEVLRLILENYLIENYWLQQSNECLTNESLLPS